MRALLSRVERAAARACAWRASSGPRPAPRRTPRALGDDPQFGLMLLGLGPDAHIASLFPGRPETHVTDRLVVGVPEAGLEPFVPRISLTLPAIDAAAHKVFLVTGAGKVEAMRRAFGDAPDVESPAAHVRPVIVLRSTRRRPDERPVHRDRRRRHQDRHRDARRRAS